MKIQGPVSMLEVLTVWARHEAGGRHGNDPALFLTSEGTVSALEILFRFRGPLLAHALQSYIRAHVACLEPPDIDQIFALNHPLRRYSHDVEGFAVGNPAGDYVRALRDADVDVDGPLIAISRESMETFTLIDGLHRASAWVLHSERGRPYGISAHVIVVGGSEGGECNIS